VASSRSGKHDNLAPHQRGIRVHPPHAGKHDADARVRGGSRVHPVREGIAAACARLGLGTQGAVARRQLLAAGVSRHAIDHALSSQQLHRRHRGVYIVGHLALAPYAQEAAAFLACGAAAVLSHRSAAYLWGLVRDRPLPPELTVVGRNPGERPGIRVHRSKHLDRRDVRTRHGLPVTSPSRTVIDLAATNASDTELERVIAEGRNQGLVRRGELEKALERAGSRPGTARLRALLRAEGDPGITRSEGERVLRRYLRAAGLPQPVTNRKLGGWEPDFLWPSEKVIVELDSWPFHRDRRAFERDRRKDMELRDAGYTVIRITGRQLVEEPLRVIAHIARALDRATRIHS
jgi:very-short-patch-repair endonuclease